jgi:membrane-bound lytic murein transglycosylase F
MPLPHRNMRNSADGGTIVSDFPVPAIGKFTLRFVFLRLIVGIFVLLSAFFALSTCGPDEARLANFRAQGELRVATRLDALSYRDDGNGGYSGFEHDLLIELGQRLGVPVRFVVYPDAVHALDAVINGHAHLAAAGLTYNERLPLAWTAALREVDFVLVGRTDGHKRNVIERESGLAGRVVTVRRSGPVAETIEQIRQRVPKMEVVHPLTHADDQTLLARLAAGQLDLLATDRVHYALAAQISPDLHVAYDLPLKSNIAWALPLKRDGDGGLAETIDAFLADGRDNGLIARVADRYFGHVRRLDEQDVSTFLNRVENRLPRYMPHFREASARTGIDWRYLAALSYQESHWEPDAVSRTGVRGMMMLTNDTADRLGIGNRLDPRQSILGGARYIAMLQEQLPEDVPHPDRLWMATAAYNLGMGHFNSARALARRLGKDDTSWLEIKAVLPLLSRPQYWLKSGPAPRGHEALTMTENIRNYYDILNRIDLEAEKSPRLGEIPPGPRLNAQGAR